MSLAIAVLRAPILSPSPLQAWRALGATVYDGASATCTVKFNDGADTFKYTVDTLRWVQTALQIEGDTAYSAVYRWHDFQGMSILDTVALKGDTLMGSGGLMFDSIRVNGILGVTAGSRDRGIRHVDESVRSRSLISIGAHELRIPHAFDLAGRAVHGIRAAPPGRFLAPGVYVTRRLEGEVRQYGKPQ
jgi:hypothetical protein